MSSAQCRETRDEKREAQSSWSVQIGEILMRPFVSHETVICTVVLPLSRKGFKDFQRQSFEVKKPLARSAAFCQLKNLAEPRNRAPRGVRGRIIIPLSVRTGTRYCIESFPRENISSSVMGISSTDVAVRVAVFFRCDSLLFVHGSLDKV